MPIALGTLLFFLGLLAVIAVALRVTILGRGVSVPLRTMLQKTETASYPERPRPVTPRFHGKHQLNRYPDGLERCIGCELCAWACPADAIYVQGADNTAEARYSPGERYAEDYQINYSRCIFCGLCLEACPTRALTMTHDYEISADTRLGLIHTKDMLITPVPTGGYDTPHLDREVRARDTNYYGGLAVTPPTLKGGTYEPATTRRRYRASDVVPGQQANEDPGQQANEDPGQQANEDPGEQDAADEQERS